MAKIMKQKVYQVSPDGSIDYINTIKTLKAAGDKSARVCPKMKEFLDSNKNRLMTDEQARFAWLAVCSKNPTFSGNFDGTLNKGFDMNIPWVAKRCSAIKIYVEK